MRGSVRETLVTPTCEFLSWDSDFFGFSIGRVRGDHLTERDSQSVMEWCRKEGIRCLYFLCAADDDESVLVAERYGFHLVDVRLDFLRRIQAFGEVFAGREIKDSVRPYAPGDEEGILAIAANSYRQTRFYYDRHFPVEKASGLYCEWARKSCAGWADAVLVAPARAGVGGFVTCHIDSPSRGRIGLVGVHDEMRGEGIGQLVVNAALSFFTHRGVTEVMVATQGRNLPAQRLYQKCGFRTQGAAYWYHLWIGGEEGR